MVLSVAAFAVFGRYEGPVPQKKSIVVRGRYWLYYMLTFMTGARRQLFIAFGGFLLVKRFGYSVADMATLMLVTTAANVALAPRLGRLVMRVGERRTIMLENVVLIVVFAGYATTGSALVAGALFVIDGVFFTLTLAQRTYFQKIADPADMAATTSAAFTINHIAAVAVPVTFGALGMIDPPSLARGGRGEHLAHLRLLRAAPSRTRPRDGARRAAPAAGGIDCHPGISREISGTQGRLVYAKFVALGSGSTRFALNPARDRRAGRRRGRRCGGRLPE